MSLEGFQRIGHGGASAVARGNTLASFDAALDIGVDVIEFDVRRRGRELVLAHTVLHARQGHPVALGTALRHLARPAFDGISLALDLKHTGLEAEVLDAVRAEGLMERAMFCSQVALVLDRIRQHEPQARTAISVGGRAARASQRWGDWRARVLAGLERRRWDTLMAQHRLIDHALVADVRARERQLFAWTVNEREGIARLRGLGVDGVATADPRLFA